MKQGEICSPSEQYDIICNEEIKISLYVYMVCSRIMLRYFEVNVTKTWDAHSSFHSFQSKQAYFGQQLDEPVSSTERRVNIKVTSSFIEASIR